MTTKPKTTTKKKTTTVKTTLELPPNPFIFEILALVNKQRTKAKKVEVLKKYEHDSLKAIFIWNFDETVISLLPSGEVPYSSLKDEQVTTGTLSTKISHAVGTMEYLQSDSMGLSDMKKGKTTIRKEWTKFYNFLGNVIL